MKKYFENITWPKAARVRKEFIIIAVSTIIIAFASAGLNMLAQYLLNLVY